MKEILQDLKKKYLSFDKSKSKYNFMLNQNTINLSNTNYNNINTNTYKTINVNNCTSIDFSTPIKNNENNYTIDRYSSVDKNNFFYKNPFNYNFSEMYNKSMEKIFQKKIKNKLPNLKSISNSSNIIIQKIRRHVLFTEDNYPYSLNDNEYGYKTLKAKEKKDILKENKCILEQIDNEEYMSKIKYMFNEELMNKEKISFKEKNSYNHIINILIKKINISKYDNSSSMIKEFFVKRDYKTYLAGKLSINSVLIKIVNLKNGQERNISLPFIIIPFYLSIPRDVFSFFVSKILFMQNVNKNEKEENKSIDDIDLDIRKIEENLKIIVSNFCLFEKNSILFDEKKLEKEIFYLFIDDNTYSLSIIPPYIELSKNEEKIKVKKIISKGLWLALFQENFKDWDLMCLTYLYCFQSFRQMQYSTIKFNSTKIINLDIDEIYNNNINIPRIKYIDKRVCFFIYNNEVINGKDNFLFMILYFYSLDQIYVKQQYKLFFNIEQTKILLSLNKDNNNLLSVLYKCSLENEQHKGINLNFPLIKTIQQGKINNYFNKNKINTKKYNNKKYSKSYKYIYKKGLNIKLNLPKIEIYETKISKVIKKDFEIKEDILNKMLEIDLIEILKIIGNYVIKNINSDANKIGDPKKVILRAKTNNIKAINFIKNNFILKNENNVNNNNNNKDNDNNNNNNNNSNNNNYNNYNNYNNNKNQKEGLSFKKSLFNKNSLLQLTTKK